MLAGGHKRPVIVANNLDMVIFDMLVSFLWSNKGKKWKNIFMILSDNLQGIE